MKTTRKLLLTIGLTLIVVIAYSQATPSAEFRVAAMDTDFGISLPIGTKIFCIATGKYYVTIAPTAADQDLTSAAANFVGISDLDLVQRTDTSYSLASSTGDTTMLLQATSTEAGLMTATQFNALADVGVYTVITRTVTSAEASSNIIKLATAPKTDTPLTISLNGYELLLGTQFSFDYDTEDITFTCTIYENDQVTASYVAATTP